MFHDVIFFFDKELRKNIDPPRNHLTPYSIKGALSGLRRFLATESPLNIMKHAFYFTLKVLFVLKIFKFLFWHFGHV